jgi:glycosyltransferase involved in cell wall biosynthesis
VDLLQKTILDKTDNKLLAAVGSKVIRNVLIISEKVFGKINLGCMNYNKALKILNEYSAKPTNTAVANEPIANPNIDLSIVVPVYNGKKFIKECMDSILNQKTKYKLQIIVVNDGSTDSTGLILNKYRNDKRIEIITQENKGFSGARNSGIDKASGRYIMFVDSDDYIYDNAIDSLMGVAISRDADIVQGEYCHIDMSGKYITFSHLNDDAIKPRECGRNNLPGYPWAKVYKRNLFSKVRFPQNYWFEDYIISNIVYQLANKIYTIGERVYAYRININGITQSFRGKRKCIDTIWILEELCTSITNCNVVIDSDWLISIANQIVDNTYCRLHDLPIKIQKASYSVIYDTYRKYERLSVNDKQRQLVLNNRKVNAVRNGNFNLWKITCLKKRWGMIDTK